MNKPYVFNPGGIDNNVVEVWSKIYVPNELDGHIKGELRKDIRAAVKKIENQGNGILHAEHITPRMANFDFENRLIFNIGEGSFSHLAQKGLIIEGKYGLPFQMEILNGDINENAKWNPADDYCMACKILLNDNAPEWSIDGEIYTIELL